MAGSLAHAVGRAIRKFRMSRDISQVRLSEMTELSVKTISQIETGAIATNLDIVEVICVALAVPPKELFDEFSKFQPYIPKPTAYDALDILSRLLEDYAELARENDVLKEKLTKR